MFLQRCKAQTVGNLAPSHEINYVTHIRDLLDFKEYYNCIIGLKLTAIWLNAWILPNGGVALGRVCNQWRYSV